MAHLTITADLKKKDIKHYVAMSESTLPNVILLVLIFSLGCVTGSNPAAELVYEWVSVDYDWPNDTMKADYISSGKFIKENNVISGIKVYKEDVFLTVPRWREGVPSTLNRVITKDGKHVLEPFPDWKSQTIGDCESLQYVQSMEVDPNLGWMWIIDVGRINTLSRIPGSTPQNLCPAKLLVYDLTKKQFIRRYEFPASVVSPTTNFINDIVVDYVEGKPQYAYITDTSSDPGLVVYDVLNNSSHRFVYLPAMAPETDRTNITINSNIYETIVPIDGIALSPDSRFLYFCPLSAYSLYQVSTKAVRNPSADFGAAVYKVGEKVSQTDGMVYGQKNLYFGVLGLNGVYKWEISKDAGQTQDYDRMTMQTQTPVALDNTGMQWVDTFAFGENGYLWYTSGKLQKYFEGTLDFSDTGPFNMRVWKVHVGEKGYLQHNTSASNLLLSQYVLNLVAFSYTIQATVKIMMTT